MPKIVQIRKRENGRIVSYDIGELRLEPGDYCVLEAERGVDYGQVCTEPADAEGQGEEPLRKIIRKVTPEDLGRIDSNREEADNAFGVCQKKIEEKELPMKLVAAEYSFDKSRLLFYFTADGRVDFRELVKELAGVFKTRIELRQIGVRDEAKMLGGVGPCGRHLCCASFLHDFEPINIRMAKTQRQPLDPEKISGVCGRLLCCLKYEDEFYRSISRKFPKDGQTVTTAQGEGKVLDANYIKGTVLVELEDERKLEFPRGEVKIKKDG